MGYHGEELIELAPPLERGIRRFGRNATEDVGRELRRRVRANTPVAKASAATRASYPSSEAWVTARGGRVPGTLRDSWQIGEVELRFGGDSYRVPVFTHDAVAPHVEWDTMPHLIAPRKPGGVLTIPTRTGMVFATLVHHPGTQGAHMMATALQEVAAQWQRIVARQWRNEARSARFWRGA